MRDWEKDDLAAHNEMIRAIATGANALSVSTFGFAVLKPMLDHNSAGPIVVIFWIALSLAMHRSSHYILRNLKKEKSK